MEQVQTLTMDGDIKATIDLAQWTSKRDSLFEQSRPPPSSERDEGLQNIVERVEVRFANLMRRALVGRDGSDRGRP